MGKNRKGLTIVTGTYATACAVLYWFNGAALLDSSDSSMAFVNDPASMATLILGGILYTAWLPTYAWWYAWGDGAEEVRGYLVHPMRNPLLNAFRILAVGWVAIPILFVVFFFPYGVLRCVYSAVNCTARLPEKRRLPARGE